MDRVLYGAWRVRASNHEGCGTISACRLQEGLSRVNTSKMSPLSVGNRPIVLQLDMSLALVHFPSASPGPSGHHRHAAGHACGPPPRPTQIQIRGCASLGTGAVPPRAYCQTPQCSSVKRPRPRGLPVSMLIPWVLAGRWMTHPAWVRHTQGTRCLAPRMPMQSSASMRYRRVY